MNNKGFTLIGVLLVIFLVGLVYFTSNAFDSNDTTSDTATPTDVAELNIKDSGDEVENSKRTVTFKPLSKYAYTGQALVDESGPFTMLTLQIQVPDLIYQNGWYEVWLEGESSLMIGKLAKEGISYRLEHRVSKISDYSKIVIRVNGSGEYFFESEETPLPFDLLQADL